MLHITNQSLIERVYQRNKQKQRYNTPLPPAAHPAPDDTVVDSEKKKSTKKPAK